MANAASFPLSVVIIGDGVSLTASVGVTPTPTSVSLVSAFASMGTDQSPNISSVTLTGSTVTFNFTLAFTGSISVEIALAYPAVNHPELQPVVQVTSPWTVAGTVTANEGGVWTVQQGTPPWSVTFPSPQHVIADSITAPLPSGTNVLGHVINDAGSAVIGHVITDANSVAAVTQTTTPWVVSLGNNTGKTNVMQVGTLTTTSVTANQVILTYTVTAGKTFYMLYLRVAGSPSVFANNVPLGTISMESPAGTKLFTIPFVFPSNPPNGESFSEPIPFAAGTVIRVVCTPATTTSTNWFANFGGYEK